MIVCNFSYFILIIVLPFNRNFNQNYIVFNCGMILTYKYTWSDKKVHELIAVKVLHTSLLNTTVVTFKVLPLGSCALMPAPSPPFKTILELILWNGFHSYCCITPNVIKIPSFQYFLYLQEQKKSLGARSGE